MRKIMVGSGSLISVVVVLILLFLPAVFASGDVVDSAVERALWMNDTVRVIVDLKEDTTISTVGDDIKVSAAPAYDKQSINTTQIFSTIDGFAAEVTDEGLDQLKENPAVEQVYLDRPVRAFLTSSVPLINASATWPILMNLTNVTGAGQTVCIIDTGIDYTHSSLGNCTTSQFLAGTCSKVVGGYDFANDDDDPMDDHGHGTHVAGIVAANGAVQGVAPDAKIVAIKALDSGGGGFSSDIIAGIEWCTYNTTKYNISVISMSLGSSTLFSTYCDSSDSLMAEAINAAVGKNISVVVATGNAGSNTGISTPACIFNSTAVASTTKSDAMSSFSNTNNITDVLAPGSSITSTARGGGTTTFSGTSMATPHVAGAFALLQQFVTLEFARLFTPFDIEGSLKQTGNNITDSDNGLSFPRINVLGALHTLDTIAPRLVFASSTPIDGSIRNRSVALAVSSNEGLSSAVLEVVNQTGMNVTLMRENEVTWSAQLSLNDGNYTYRAFGNDSKGNTAFTETRTLVVDATPPVLVIAQPVNGTVFTTSALSINYSVSDLFSVDGCTLVNATGHSSVLPHCSNATIVGVRGYQNISLIVNDSVGNTRSQTIFFTVSLSPIVTLHSPENKTYTANISLPLNFSSIDEDLSMSWYSLDGGVNITVTTNATFNTTEGNHSLTFYANDSMNQLSSVQVNFTVDSVGPAIIFISPGPDIFLINTTNLLLINATVDEAVSGAVLEFNGVNETLNGSGTGWFTTKILADGVYTFRVYVNDSLNNTGTSLIRTVNISTIRNHTSYLDRVISTVGGGNVTLRLVFNGSSIDASNVSVLFNYTLEFNASGLLVKIANFSWLNVNDSALLNVTTAMNAANITPQFASAGAVLNKLVWVDVGSFLHVNYTPVVFFDGTYPFVFRLDGEKELPNATRIGNVCDVQRTNVPCFVVGENKTTVYMQSFSGAAVGNDNEAPRLNVSSPLQGEDFSSTSVALQLSVSDNVGVDSCSYSINSGVNTSLASCGNVTLTAVSGVNTLRVYVDDTSNNLNQTERNFTVTIAAESGGSPGGSAASGGGSGGGGGGGGGGSGGLAPKKLNKANETKKEVPVGNGAVTPDESLPLDYNADTNDFFSFDQVAPQASEQRGVTLNAEKAKRDAGNIVGLVFAEMKNFRQSISHVRGAVVAVVLLLIFLLVGWFVYVEEFKKE